jgi:hypothetical protein
MAIKFAAYESMRQIHQKVYKGRPATPQEDFAFGAVAGALAAASTTPLDVIKVRLAARCFKKGLNSFCVCVCVCVA